MGYSGADPCLLPLAARAQQPFDRHYVPLQQTVLEIVSWISIPIDTGDDAQRLALIKSSIKTKFDIS